MNPAGRISFKEFDFTSDYLRDQAILLLNSNSATGKHNVAFWNWRFMSNPFGDSKGWYALDNETGQMAGLLMWWPWIFRSPDGDITGYQAINGITAPEYRNMGIFLNLNKCAISYLSENNYLLFGFPNDGSLPAYKRLKWHTAEKIFLYVTPVSFLKPLKCLIRGIRNDGIIPEEHVLTDPRFSILQPSGAIRTRWDRASLKWRFCDHPERKYYFFESRSGELIYRVRHFRQANEAQIVFTNPRGQRLFSDFRSFLKEYSVSVTSYYGSDTGFLRQVKSSVLTYRHFKRAWLVMDRKTKALAEYPFKVEFCDMDTK